MIPLVLSIKMHQTCTLESPEDQQSRSQPEQALIALAYLVHK